MSKKIFLLLFFFLVSASAKDGFEVTLSGKMMLESVYGSNEQKDR